VFYFVLSPVSYSYVHRLTFIKNRTCAPGPGAGALQRCRMQPPALCSAQCSYILCTIGLLPNCTATTPLSLSGPARMVVYFRISNIVNRLNWPLV
jgi:hypothetical protein